MPSSGTTWHNDYGIDTIEIVGSPIIDREQDGFRYYDDGTESGATALENEDVDLTIGKETTFQLRVGSQMTGDAPAESCAVEYKENTDAASEWRKVP